MCFFVNRYIDPYSLFKCLPSIEGKKRPLKVIFLYEIHFAYLLFRGRPRLHFYGLSYREKKVTWKLYDILPSINITCRKNTIPLQTIQYVSLCGLCKQLFAVSLANIFSIFIATVRFIDIENQYKKWLHLRNIWSNRHSFKNGIYLSIIRQLKYTI